MYKFLCRHVFTSLGVYLEVGLLGHMVTLCLTLVMLTWQSAFPDGSWTILHYLQQCRRIPVSPHLCQHLLSSVFLIMSILIGVNLYHTVILIYISLVGNDLGHLFLYWLAIHIFFFEKCLYNSFAHLKIELPSYYWVVRLLHSWYTSSLSDIRYANISYHSVGCLCIFLMASFETHLWLNAIYLIFFGHLGFWCCI